MLHSGALLAPILKQDDKYSGCKLAPLWMPTMLSQEWRPTRVGDEELKTTDEAVTIGCLEATEELAVLKLVLRHTSTRPAMLLPHHSAVRKRNTTTKSINPDMNTLRVNIHCN